MTASCEIWRDFFYVSIPYQKNPQQNPQGSQTRGQKTKSTTRSTGHFWGTQTSRKKSTPNFTTAPPEKFTRRSRPQKNFTPKIHAKLHSKIHAKFHVPKRRRDMLPDPMLHDPKRNFCKSWNLMWQWRRSVEAQLPAISKVSQPTYNALRLFFFVKQIHGKFHYIFA